MSFDKTIHLPRGQNYECIQCGRSCGEFWEIQVEPEMVESIRSRPAQALAAARDPQNPVVESPFTPGQAAMRLHEGRCCMQTGGGLCALHAAFGLEAKPNVCRSFPYRFIETPAGVFTGISFACTAVLGNLGPAVADQASEVRRTHDFTVHKRKIEQPPDLTGDLPLSWAQYEKIEADLDALMDPALGSIDRRLLTQSIYLGMLAKFLRQTRGEAGAALAAAQSHDAVLDHFRKQMRGSAEEPWPTVRRIAAHRRRSPMLRRVCLGAAHELRNVYGRRRGRGQAYAEIFSMYAKCAVGVGRFELPGMKAPVSHRAIESTAFDPAAPDIDELLTRYFRHRLFRKDLLTGDQVLWSHQMQLLHWGLIQWYAAALARDAGRDRVTLEDLREGLHKVEKYYVMHSTFDRLFVAFPMLRGFLDRLFNQPLYAFSMARGGWWQCDG